MTTTFKEFFNELKESTFCDTDMLKDLKLTPEQFFWLTSQCLKSGQNLNVFLYLLKKYPINIDNMEFYEKLLIQSVTLCSNLESKEDTYIDNQYKCLDLLIKGSEKYIYSFKGGKLFDYFYFERLISIEVLKLFKNCGSYFLQVKNEYCLCYMVHSGKSIETLTNWINVIGLPKDEHSLFFKRFIQYMFIEELNDNNLELIDFIKLLNTHLSVNCDEMLNVIIEHFDIETVNNILLLQCLELLLKDINRLKHSDIGYKVLSTKNPVLLAHLGRYDLNWNKEDITGNTGFDLFSHYDLTNKAVELNPLVLNLLKKESVPDSEGLLGSLLMQSYSEVTESVKTYVKAQVVYNTAVGSYNKLENYIDIESDEDLTILKKITNQNDPEHIMVSFSEFCVRNNLRVHQEKITKNQTYCDIVLSIDKELNKSFRDMYLPLSCPLITSFIKWAEGIEEDLLSLYTPLPQTVCKELGLLVPTYTEEEISDDMEGVEHWEEGKVLTEKYKSEINADEDISYNTFRKLYINNTVEESDKEVIENFFKNRLESLVVPSLGSTEEKKEEVQKTVEVIDEAFISQELFSQKDKDDFIAENKTEEERKEVKKLVLQLSGKGVFNKKLLAKSTNLFAQIENLYYNFPHFEKVIQHLENHCHLQKAGNGVFYIPPLLFAGGPGVGKTFFAHQLSMLVKTNFHMFNMESMTAGWILMGLNGSWSGSATGKVFDVLMKKEMMNPIFLLDEIDKCPKGSYSAENALLSLLEQYTAKNFRDECVPLPIDASNIIWFATANNLQSISAPIKSRFDIFNIPSPNSEQKKALISNIYRSVLSSNSWGVKFSGNLPSATLDILSQTMTPGAARDLRKIITTGCSKAIRANRDELRIEDLESFEQPALKPWDMMAIEAT